jgi:hypothetical protein
MKELYPSASRCAYELCKRSDPITITPGHRRKLYHDDACRQAQHRLLSARRTYETLRQLWAAFLPETRAVLQQLLEEHGEEWTRRLIRAICAERDQARQPALTEDERAAVRAQYADFQPFTRNILDALTTQPHETLGLLNLVLLAIGEERRHASCNSELEQRAAYLEVALAEYRNMIDLEDRERIGQQFLAMGELLGYRALAQYRLGQGIDRWQDYRSWTDERTMAEIILFAREILAQEEAASACAQERCQLKRVERELKEERARREELERQLLSPAPVPQITNLDRDLAAVRINVASAELFNTPYGQALLAVVEREREVDHLKRRIQKQYERRITKLQARLGELEAERAEWVEWRQARLAGCGDLEAMRTFLQEHDEATIPIKRNGVVMKVWALGPDGVACTEDHGILRLNDEELQQGRVWVCKKLGLPIIVTRLPIGSKRDSAREDE